MLRALTIGDAFKRRRCLIPASAYLIAIALASALGGFAGPRIDDGVLDEVKAPRADGTLSP